MWRRNGLRATRPFVMDDGDLLLEILKVALDQLAAFPSALRREVASTALLCVCIQFLQSARSGSALHMLGAREHGCLGAPDHAFDGLGKGYL
jgi:hypothetical protein